nr:reverse transcriptase domain-containing protein [Tanacetum cinerariifolium]
VILKKLPDKLRDPGKFLISYGFSELKCKALADLVVSINLMPLSVWKNLGFPQLISTRTTLELANRAICTPAGIARDVFVSVGKFTFPTNYIIVDYESDLRVPLIFGRPFLRTAHALIDVHGEEMIVRDEDFLEDLFSTNQPGGNPTFSSHPELTSLEVQDDIFDLEGGNVLPEKFLDLDSTKDLHPPLNVNPLSGSTTYSSSPNQLIEELADELALITFPLKYNDDLYNLDNPADNFVDSMPEMFTDEHALDYSSPLIFNEYDDDFLEVEFDTKNVYDDPFDSKGEKIKEYKLLIDELDLPCDLCSPSEYDSCISQDFSRVDAKPSTNNEDKVFNPCILIQENPFEIITRVVQHKKLATSNASLVLKDFDPPFYEPLFFKEVPRGSPPVARKRTPAFYSHLGGSCFQIHQRILPPSRTTNHRNEISNFQQRFDESFHKAWDRYKDFLRACRHHCFTELHQLDTFYNALNPFDQDSLNAAAGGNLLERRTQDVFTIIENKSKVRNNRNKAVVSQVKSCDVSSNSSSEIAKLTHAVNQHTSVVTTAMTAILKQFQATPPPASVKSIEEICVTYGGAHPYYQCLAVDGNTFPELQDIQGYVSAAAVNYNHGNSIYHPSGSGSLPSNTVANPKGELRAITTRSGLVLDGPTVLTHRPFINPKKDERVEETLMDPDLFEYTIKVPPPPKLPEKLRDPGKFLIPCGFSELNCKALADLDANINLMPLSVWKKLGLPELISTRMTVELANRAICTPAGIARDVFFLVGKFTFLANLVIVDYESDPRVTFISGRPFLRTARALIDVHGEEMIVRDGDERLTLNIRHDTSRYSNQPQKESINLINVFNNSRENFLEDLFSTNQPGGNVLPKKLLDLDFIKDLHPSLHVNPLSGSTTYSFSPNQLLEELANSCLKVSVDQSNLANPADNFVDSMPEMFTDEHAFDYSSPLIFGGYDDDFLEVKSDTENVYDDPFDSKGEKIKESKLLIDELDLPCDFCPHSEYDSCIYQDFSRVDAKPSTNNEDKVFNPGILIQENPFEIITRVVQNKKLTTSNASLVLEDFDLPSMNLFSSKKFLDLRCYSYFHLKMRKKFSNQGFTVLKKFILLLSQNYLIKAIKFSKSTKFSKAR